MSRNICCAMRSALPVLPAVRRCGKRVFRRYLPSSRKPMSFAEMLAHLRLM